MRKKKPKLTVLFTNPNKSHSTLFRFSNKAAIVSYRSKKENLLLCLVVYIILIIMILAWKKSINYSRYNETNICVERKVKIVIMVSTYSLKCMSGCWPLIVFYKMLDVSAMNALIIWLPLNTECDQKMKKRRNFIIQHAVKLTGYEKNVAVPKLVSDVHYTNAYEQLK